MANTIKIKSSGTTSNVPAALEHGELAINYADGKLYYKNSSNSIVEFAGGAGGGSVTISDTPPSSPSAGDLWYESDTGSFYIYYDSQWISVSGTVPSATVISDADGDTKIQTEESPDEDKIRFDTVGVERVVIDSSGLSVNGNLVVTGTHPTQSINSQSGSSYTFVLSDAQKLVTFTNASPVSATIPPNSSVAFPVGTHIDVAQLGAGATTIVAGSGVTVNKHADDTLVLNGQYSYGSIIKTATDTWTLIGRLVPV